MDLLKTKTPGSEALHKAHGAGFHVGQSVSILLQPAGISVCPEPASLPQDLEIHDVEHEGSSR